MGVKTGIVVYINGGDRVERTHPVCHLPEQFSDITVIMFAARPAAVIVELVIEAAQAMFRGMRVTDQDGQGTGQLVELIMAFQQPPDRFPAGDFIAMLQNGNKKRLWVFAFKVNQRRTTQGMVQGRCGAFQQPGGYMIKLG